jgi:Fe-S-cluster containining protein
MTMDRPQRRTRRRELLALGATRLKRGLPSQPSETEFTGVAMTIRATLADRKHIDAPSRAAGIMHAVFEASVAAQPSRLQIACRKGCGFCCHTWVAATAPEIFLLARAAKAAAKQTPVLSSDHIRTRAALTAGLDIAGRFGKKLPCAVLIENACGLYAARPTVCRQVIATDLAGCLDEFEGRDFDGVVTASRTLLDHATNCRIPLLAALVAADLPADSYELSAGLEIALEPDAERAWLDGRDPFAGVAAAPPLIGPVRQIIDHIAAELRML